mmetsp:Transcript_82941/g.129516  ORF Transcript_82941/g.129516 Transcript_82941/m.129516 type:complete len:190 (-) Transcript_82941:326-895(-)
MLVKDDDYRIDDQGTPTLIITTSMEASTPWVSISNFYSRSNDVSAAYKLVMEIQVDSTVMPKPRITKTMSVIRVKPFGSQICRCIAAGSMIASGPQHKPPIIPRKLSKFWPPTAPTTPENNIRKVRNTFLAHFRRYTSVQVVIGKNTTSSSCVNGKNNIGVVNKQAIAYALAIRLASRVPCGRFNDAIS